MQLLIYIILICSVQWRNSLKHNNKIFDFSNEKDIQIHSPPTSLLIEKDVSRINTFNNALKYGAEYLTSENYIDEQEEYNLRNAVENNYENDSCFFNRQKFMEYLNIIRDKHSVSHILWNKTLEHESKVFVTNLKLNNKCNYEENVERMFVGEAVYQGPQRLTEKELLQKWYRPAYYNYNFKNMSHNLELNVVEAYPMSLLLWDDVRSVGCSKICCKKKELTICLFLPIVSNPNILTMAEHIKPNKFLLDNK